MTYDFQLLKEVIEFIFGQLKKNEDRVHNVDTKLVSKFMLIDKLKNENEDFKKEFIVMKNIQKELEQKSIAADADISAMKSDIESCKMNLSLFGRQYGSLPTRMYEVEDKLDEFSKRLDDLFNKMQNQKPIELPPMSEGSGIDAAALQQLLNDFAKKSDFRDLLSRIEDVEKEQSNMSEKLDKTDHNTSRLSHKHKKWRPKWVQMQLQINEIQVSIKQKADLTYMNEQLDIIKNLINQLASSGQEITVPLIPTGPQLIYIFINQCQRDPRAQRTAWQS